MRKQLLETKLNKALMDQYHARDTYRKIIETFGESRSFANLLPLSGTGNNDSGKSW